MDLLRQLNDLSDDATLYARRPWGSESQATSANEGSTDAEMALASGQDYLLEVALAKDVVDTWASWRNGRVPRPEDVVEAVIHYAETDSYLPTSDEKPADSGDV
jgi:hypothetical protein